MVQYNNSVVVSNCVHIVVVYIAHCVIVHNLC